MSEWALSEEWQDPLVTSQSRTVQSSDAEATSLLFGENATVRTILEWPLSIVQDPVVASQSPTLQSSDADATSLPCSENVTPLIRPEWPWSVLTQDLFSTSQSRISR